MIEDARRRATALLEMACQETSNTAVAKKLGYSRGAISCVRRGCYTGDSDKVLAKALETFGRIPCPYLRREITQNECRAVLGGATPSHDPAALAHRRACRSCTYQTGGGS